MNNKNPITYKETIDNLITFLKDATINKIIFHQFDFLIMYYPVYMVISDLKDRDVTVEFMSKENDKAIIQYMLDDKIMESFDAEHNTLHLGLCEPVVSNKTKWTIRNVEIIMGVLNKGDDQTNNNMGLRNPCIGKTNNGVYEAPYFMHLPFVNFPPIYGVSLINRNIINVIKRSKSRDGVIKTGEKGEEKELSIIDYWRHFSAKLSLLDKNDFKKLIASSYPIGSTTDWFIREKIKFETRGFTWVESLKKEFDDLFNGIVDVAFTIQPWVAVSQSEFRNPPLDIDIVYKDVCKEFDCTSLIFKTNKKEYFYVGDYILNSFNVLLKGKIKELYKCDSESLDKHIKSYCVLSSEHCNKNHKENGDNENTCTCCLPCDNKEKEQGIISSYKGCIFENKMALRLNIDSQIYQHLRWIEKEELKVEKVVANYFVEKFGGSKEGIDKFCDGLCCHTSEVRNG